MALFLIRTRHRPWKILAVVCSAAFLAYVLYGALLAPPPESLRVVCPPAKHAVPLAPDVVRFVHLDDGQPLSFVCLVCALAAWINQRPSGGLVFHADQPEALAADERFKTLLQLIGKENLRVEAAARPTHVFGAPLAGVSHAADILRLATALEKGGLFLDEDTYVVQRVGDGLRAKEVVLGRHPGQNVGTQYLLAKPSAPFLQLWLASYRRYRPSLWYHNAGEVPTKDILDPCPRLAHQEKRRIGVDVALAGKIYGREPWPEWRSYLAIHLLSRHAGYLTGEMTDFDEENVWQYEGVFGEMARDVLTKAGLKRNETRKS